MDIVWDEIARDAFREHILYIKQDSLQAAESVRLAIIERNLQLSEQPFRYRTDELKLDNDGSYRVFTHLRCRISYRVEKELIRIVRFRHTSQQTELY